MNDRDPIASPCVGDVWRAPNGAILLVAEVSSSGHWVGTERADELYAYHPSGEPEQFLARSTFLGTVTAPGEATHWKDRPGWRLAARRLAGVPFTIQGVAQPGE